MLYWEGFIYDVKYFCKMLFLNSRLQFIGFLFYFVRQEVFGKSSRGVGKLYEQWGGDFGFLFLSYLGGSVFFCVVGDGFVERRGCRENLDLGLKFTQLIRVIVIIWFIVRMQKIQFVIVVRKFSRFLFLRFSGSLKSYFFVFKIGGFDF